MEPDDLNLLPDDRGIYFLLSHNRTRLQKIGMTNGQGGLRQRMLGYRASYNPANPAHDPTRAFWYRIMTGAVLGGEQPMPGDYGMIDVYFMTGAQNLPINHPLPNALGIANAVHDPHADLEQLLIEQVRQLRNQYLQEHPMQPLFPHNYPYPLLLDSDNRLLNNQFAPG